MKLSYKKRNRLRKNRDFKVVYDTGFSFANRYLVMYVLRNSQDLSRVGISAGKKLGGAVVRNRCKRRIRECCRLYREYLPQGYDIIFICRNQVITCTWDELERNFIDLCRRMQERLQRLEIKT